MFFIACQNEVNLKICEKNRIPLHTYLIKGLKSSHSNNAIVDLQIFFITSFQRLIKKEMFVQIEMF